MPKNTGNVRVRNVPTKTREGGHISEWDGKREISKFGAGDSYYIPGLVKTKHEREEVFAKLLNEVDFVQMFYFSNEGKTVEPIPRMVSAQTCKSGDSSAIYRMPGCNQRNINTEHWTPTVNDVCKRASEAIGQTINHCVCTLYRDNDDSLAFHQDKLLDLEENSVILSLSFGEPRPIVFQEIGGKQKHTITLQPGSLLAIGPKTNKQWRHAVPKLAESCGPRISLSARSIRSFVDSEDQVIGQGQEFQEKNYPFITSYDNTTEYSESVREQISEYTKAAESQLEKLRAAVSVE